MPEKNTERMSIVAHEKEQVSKLEQLDLKDLIPSELEQIPEVTGAVKVWGHKLNGYVDYVITDEEQMTLSQLRSDFTYFDESSFADYPELEVRKDYYARPLLYGSMSEISPKAVLMGVFETNPALRGKGVGVVFQEHLASLMKKLGYKFMVGYQNNAELARFFLKRGRYLLEEIKDELQSDFQALRDLEGDETVFYTIKFLNPDDIVKYVKSERVNVDVEDRIAYKEKVLVIGNIFYNLTQVFQKVESGADELGERATLIEVMEDLNQLLPIEERSTVSGLSEDDGDLLMNLKVLLEHLKSKMSVLIREGTLEQLRENDI